MELGTKELFCANFGHPRGDVFVGWSIWCEMCYPPLVGDRFHVNKPADEPGFEQLEAKDTNQLLEARDGDHLVCSFQCDTCLIFLLEGRTPIPRNMKDEFLMVCLRRANLDAFWAREPSIVAANRRDVNRLIKLS